MGRESHRGVSINHMIVRTGWLQEEQTLDVEKTCSL